MRHFLDAFLEPASWFAADWSLRWAVLIAIMALMLWIARPRRAALRQLLLLVALLGGLLVPFLPRWGAGWDSPPSSLRSTGERAPGRSASRSAIPRDEETPRLRKSQAAERPDVRSHAERGNEKTATQDPTSLETSEPLGRRRLVVLGLVLCWSFAVAALLIRQLCGWFVLRRLRREAVEATGAAADLFAACRSELGVRSRVRLASHSLVRSPVLLGFLRPLILVPPDWPQRPAQTQRAALLHELAHVRRGDHRLAPLLETIRIAFFFHPFVRWLLARLEREREWLCDEMVVRQGIDPRDYARLLLEFARVSGRVFGAAGALSMSRRRTVRGRIHHLLEDDVERWIRPLPWRWTIALGAGLLALTLGLTSYRVWAEEKAKAEPGATKTEKQLAVNKPAPPPIKREELRYGGKDFNQWRRELLTELKPTIRIDGLTALAAFGANGYGTEATQAVLDMMRGYDPALENSGQDDSKIVEAGFGAIRKIGTASVPALTAAVKDDNRNVHNFAIAALGRLGRDAKPALPALLQEFKNDDPITRDLAITAVGRMNDGSKEVVAAFIDLLGDKSGDVRQVAVDNLRMTGEPAKAAIPALLKALSDKEWSVRQNAIGALGQIGAGKKAVPAIIRLLQDEERNVWIEAFGYLRNLPAEDAKEAVPALAALLKTKDYNRLPEAVETLKRMGPTAKEAIPALEGLLRRDKELRGKAYTNPSESILDALKAIDPDGNH